MKRILMLALLISLISLGCTQKPIKTPGAIQPIDQTKMAAEVEKAEKGETTIMGGWQVMGGKYLTIVLDQEGQYYATMAENSYEMGKWSLEDSKLVLVPNSDTVITYEFQVKSLEATRAELILDGETQLWTRK